MRIVGGGSRYNPMHTQFEELCALSVTGQSSADVMRLLDVHVRECEQCRTFLQEMAPQRDSIGFMLAASDVVDCDLPDGMRERFLLRASDANLSLRPGPVLAGSEDLKPVPNRVSITKSLQHWIDLIDRLRARYTRGIRLALPVAAALMCTFVGYFIGHGRFSASPVQVSVSSSAIQSPVARTSATAEDAVARRENRRAQAQLDLDQAYANLNQLKTDKQHLLARLAETDQRASAGQQYRQQFEEGAQKLQHAEDRIGKLEADLAAAREKQVTMDATLLAQEQATVEAKDKLAGIQSQLEQERQISAVRSDARDLIAARNLHIVDVYDTESNGERKRAFGRVFYVEGRSLVFYAYDLAAAKHPNTKITFHVWGETAGAKATTYNLGIMHADDDSRTRWKLSFDDSEVLTRINAVYITADPVASPKSQPSGRKLMYAFLGSPNHP